MAATDRISYLLLTSLFLLRCLRGELLTNGDMESLGNWHCYGMHCELSSDHHCGSHSLKATGRNNVNQGPLQGFDAPANVMFTAQAYVKLLDDVQGKLGQSIEIVVDFGHPDGHRQYAGVAHYPMAQTADGWIRVFGNFKVPDYSQGQVRVKIQGPDPPTSFLVDCVSVTNISYGNGWRAFSDKTIHDIRQSDINLNVTIPGNVNPSDVEIQVLQTKKAFPIGTVVNAWNYEDPSKTLYRDFIHDHFNWAVHESSLKWHHVEPHPGEYHFDLPLRLLNALRGKGMKVRGHNLIWSTTGAVMDWVKQLSGDALRSTVEHHIVQTMNKTKGSLEHWDVNNENLHGFWYQERLNNFTYELTPFQIAHNADHNVKLFLNDFNIVAHGPSTGAYIEQAKRLMRANVGLYGLGVQCHFWTEEVPDPDLIKDRLDKLAETGLPVWVTEFNVVAQDENKRADSVETAMRAFYGHPAVEGIMLWGFWDKSHSRGPYAALAKGDNMQLTAAGRRFLDLWENQWMTDETHVLIQSGTQFTVRGFHGDYEVLVHYQGTVLDNLKQTFNLGKSNHTVNINIAV